MKILWYLVSRVEVSEKFSSFVFMFWNERPSVTNYTLLPCSVAVFIISRTFPHICCRIIVGKFLFYVLASYVVVLLMYLTLVARLVFF